MGRILAVVLLLVAVALWLWEPDATPNRAHRSTPDAVSETETSAEKPAEENPADTRVEVVDAAGRAIGDAQVQALDFDLTDVDTYREITSERTDADGVVIFEALDPLYIRVRKVGYGVVVGQSKEGVARITLHAAAYLRGRVILPGGAPAAGALVRAWDKDADEEIDFAQIADRDGGFAITGTRKNHSAILVVAFPGYATMQREVAGRDAVTLQFRTGSTLTGSVTDPEGRPIAAAVTVAPEGAESPLVPIGTYMLMDMRERAAMSRPLCTDGRFVVRGLPPGVYAVYAATEAGQGIARVKLAPDGHVSMIVVDQAALTVHVRTPDGTAMADWDGAFFEDEGSFQESSGTTVSCAPGRYAIFAHAYGYLATKQEIELKPGEKRTLALNLRHGLSVAICVRDPEGRRVPSVQVSLYQELFGAFQQNQTENFRGPDEWELGGCAQGPGTLRVLAEGYARQLVEVDVREGARIDVKLERLGRIAGRFAPPPEHAELKVGVGHPMTAYEREGWVAKDGSFVIENPTFRIGSGTITMTLTPRGYMPVLLREIKLRNGVTLDLGELKIEKGIPLRVTVTGHTGKPLAGAHVEVTEPHQVAGNRTGPDGTLTLANQPRACTLRITAAGHPVSFRTVDASKPVHIRLDRGVAVSGRIVDVDGQPVTGESVLFWRVNGTGHFDRSGWWWPKVDGRGNFEFRLPPGKYRARVYGGSYATLTDVFEARQGAEFVLKRE